MPCCKNKEVKLSQEEIARQSIVRQNIEWLNNANVINDGLQAIKKDSIYFVGVIGYGLIVPGVRDYRARYKNKVPVKPINGTGDFIRTDDDKKINYLATEYALQFNAIILANLEK